MERVYPITFEDRRVGEANVEQQGLFLIIRCKCDVGLRDTYRIEVCCDGNTTDLGLFVPRTSGFSLERRLPAKPFSGENLTFSLTQENKEIFIPLCADKPFERITQLSAARFTVKHGQAGIVISD